jgi:hypothetical protein
MNRIMLSNDHLGRARFYVDHINAGSAAIDNSYGGTYPDIWLRIGEGGNTESLSRCGSFLAMLLKQAYPTLISGCDVIKHAAGSTSPNASQWHDAIAAETSYAKPGDGTTSPYHFVLRGTVGDIQVGDILAAEYSAGSGRSADSTGHVMIVNAAARAPIGTEAGAAVANTQQWVVEVIDSSSSAHGNDTRRTLGNTGLGRGSILIYETLGSGLIHGWTWGLGNNTVYTQTQRNLVAGVLRGPAAGMSLSSTLIV